MNRSMMPGQRSSRRRDAKPVYRDAVDAEGSLDVRMDDLVSANAEDHTVHSVAFGSGMVFAFSGISNDVIDRTPPRQTNSPFASAKPIGSGDRQ
ncbi:MAG: hypothetical protein QM770_01480 [Tepidisphaeraceae bacterium]